MSKLRELREARGLSVEATALLANCNIGTISRIERGLQTPSPEMVVKLAKALGISALRLHKMLSEEVLEAASK